MIPLIPLAHGALGFWDEVVPMLLVGGFAAVLLVAGMISRRNEEKAAKQAQALEQAQPVQSADAPVPVETAEAVGDHFRLD
jgi:hypothetical protein